MKKRILLLSVAMSFCVASTWSQDTKAQPCDSLQILFDDALVMLDSVMGNQIELQKHLDESRLIISKLRNEIISLLKDKNKAMANLNEARKLVAGQMEQIKKLDAEVKRLSRPATSSKQKGT